MYGTNWRSVGRWNMDIICAEPGHRVLPLTGANDEATTMQGLPSLPQQWWVYARARKYGQIYQHCNVLHVMRGIYKTHCHVSLLLTLKGTNEKISLTTLLQLIRNWYTYNKHIFTLARAMTFGKISKIKLPCSAKAELTCLLQPWRNRVHLVPAVTPPYYGIKWCSNHTNTILPVINQIFQLIINEFSNNDFSNFHLMRDASN